MQGFNIVDGGVAVVILLSAILAYSRGFVREILAIGGWVVAAFLAYSFANQAEPLVKEIPVLGEFLKNSCELSIIASFSAVFAVGLIVMSFFTPLFASVVRNSVFGGIDQGLGFLFGVARGVILVAVALLLYERTMTAGATPLVSDSRSAQAFAKVEKQVSDQIPTNLPSWVVARYEQLVGNCGTASGGLKTGTTPPAAAPATPPASGSSLPATNGAATTGSSAAGTGGTSATISGN